MLKLGSMRVALAALLAIGMTAAATPAMAQRIAAETPGTALSRYIRVLAGSPRDFNALIGAGRAALELGDVQAAAGFFGRAEEVNPNAPAAKAGLGASMAHMGDADGAIFYFNQASRLGAQPITIALDRGLARDLLGDLSNAQADYRLAISSIGSDEARRRLALSLAIGRNKQAALDTIQPLLNRRDPAAQRTRAFVLALVGDQIGAAQAINSAMPGNAARFAPFFRYLPSLSVTEKAAAVHLGIFPENASARIAAAGVAPVQPEPQAAAPALPPPVRLAVNTTPPVRQPQRSAPAQPQRESNMVIAGRIPPRSSRSAVSRAPVRQPAPTMQPPVRIAAAEPPPAVPPAAPPAFSLPSASSASASPSFSLPSVTSAAPTASIEAPTETNAEPIEPVPALAGVDDALAEPKSEPLEPAPVLAEMEEVGAESKLTGIDKLLATLAEAPPPPQPKIETKKPDLAGVKKAREEAAKLGVKGIYWVQLAGGSNQDRMSVEYRKLAAKAGRLLKSRSGYVTEGKDYFRLLVGPFDSKSDSQSFVNKLEKEGVDGFSWTRTPPRIRIEKL